MHLSFFDKSLFILYKLSAIEQPKKNYFGTCASVYAKVIFAKMFKIFKMLRNVWNSQY